MAMSSSQAAHILGHAQDRLTSLPDKIINRIFSFLGTNETARLSLISRRFRHLCIHCPHLYFCAGDPDSHWCPTRYNEFISNVDALMRMRKSLGIRLERFLIHWFCFQHQYDVGEGVVNSWINIATSCDVEQLDMLFKPKGCYLLPESVYECQSLRVLRLNLQKGRFLLPHKSLDSVEELWLDSLTIADRYFADRIAAWWTSLKRLNLNSIHQITNLDIASSSLQELKISNCNSIGGFCGRWNLTISSSSFKVLNISECYFKAPCHINLACAFLENVMVRNSDFDKLAVFKIKCQWLKNLEVYGSDFSASSRLHSYCPSVNHIKISNCKFEHFCHLNTSCLSLESLTVSECKFESKKSNNFRLAPPKCFCLKAERLETLTIYSSDTHSHEFSVAISAPNLQAIRWIGNLVDFRYLERFTSLVNATIDIKPACRHRSKKFDLHCKLFKSLTCCSAKLLESLSYAKSLKISTFLIELFFMQNDEPVLFDNLLHLVLLVDGAVVAEQILVIASFLKGLRDLKTLTIQCGQKSQVLDDPNLINLLGLNMESFTISVSQDLKKVQIAAVEAPVCRTLEEDAPEIIIFDSSW